MDTSPRHIDCETLLKSVDAELRATLAGLANERRLRILATEQCTAANNYNTTLLHTVHQQDKTITKQLTELTACRQTNALQQQTIAELSNQNTLLQSLLSEQQKQLKQKERQNIVLRRQLDKFRLAEHNRKVLSKQVFGRKSEKSHDDDPAPRTFIYPETTSGEDKETFNKNWYNSKEPLPPNQEHWDKNVPRKTIILAPKNLPPNAFKVDERVMEILCHRKEKIYIKRYVRPVYLVPDEEQEGKFKNHVAALPVQLISGCRADVEIIVRLIIEKYLFHAPLHRQQMSLAHHGVAPPYSTLMDWTHKGVEAIARLYPVHVREVINGGLTHCDESPLWVIDHSCQKKGKKSRKSQMWVLCNPVQNIACFHYGKGRGHDDIKALLEGYKGYLITDSLGTYTKFGKQKGVKHGKCLGHPRRKFVEAKDSDIDRARYVLKNFINPLYAIERSCRQQQLSYDQITVMRQIYAVPILTEMFAWLKAEREKVLPRTPIYIAINYLLNMEQEIMLYTTDGMLPIDNLMVERLIKLLALGRKNYMFAGSERGAKNAAIIYTFIATCQLQKVNATAWLTDVLRRIDRHPEHKLYQLLPQNWQPAKQSVLSA
jgi:transposase